MKKIVIALGGNAILQAKQTATFETQLENVKKSCEVIANIVEAGNQVIVTHGNGPQVGNILRQNEEAKHVVPPFPLDVCNAESQGFIGYMIETCLRNEFTARNMDKEVISLLTCVEVNKDDQAFQNPTKPIGIFYTEKEAKRLEKMNSWVVKKDANRGWRRVVPSPLPMKIIGSDNMKQLCDLGKVVIASGGGGIPVVRNNHGELIGIEAVIDKDHSGSKLAREVKADIFMILTDVDHVYIHYGTAEEKRLTTISTEEACEYVKQGHFSAGSMGPKVDAAIAFAETGKPAVICSIEHANEALAGESGTWVTSN